MGELCAKKRGTIVVTAALAIAGLLSAAAWQLSLTQGPRKHTQYDAKRDSTIEASVPNIEEGLADEEWANLLASASEGAPNTSVAEQRSSASPDDEILSYAGETIGIQLLGQYIALKQSGTYTREVGERIGLNVAKNMRYVPTFERYSAESLSRTPDNSYAQVIAYRNTLREALAPLFENRFSEFELFARYVETGDADSLQELTPAAARYRTAAKQAAAISVPEDAKERHVRVLNSLLQFASVLEGMAQHGTDPFAGAVLLQTYNTAEREVFYAFDALAEYYVNKSSNL